MNIFVVKGNTMIDKATIAAGCASKAGFKAGTDYQYEWANEKVVVPYKKNIVSKEAANAMVSMFCRINVQKN